MHEITKGEKNNYRWIILVLTWLTAISLFSSINQLSPLSGYIRDGLGISGAAYGILYSSPMFGVACMAFLAGAASDRFGPRLVISCGLSLVALFAIGRSFAASTGSYGLLLACNFLMGLAFGMTYPNLPKLVGDWFPARQRGLATSFYSTGIPVGSSSAMMLTIPVFLVLAGGNWTKVPLVWGIMPLCVAILLWLFCRNGPTFVSSRASGKKFFDKAVYTNPVLWRVGLTFFCCTWVFYVCLAWFPSILAARSFSPEAAGAATGLIPLFGLLGNLIVAVLSDKIHWRSIFIIGGQVLGAISMGLMFICPDSWFYILLPLIGFFDNAAYACLAFLLPIDLVPQEQRGAAAGMIMTLGYVAALLGPTVAGAIWDASQNINVILISIMVIYLIGIIFSVRIPDPLRKKYKEQRAATQA